MAWSIVQQNEGAQNTALATVSATLPAAATAGNLLLVIVGSDAYASTPPAGFTESTGCKQQTNLGHYVWWKVAAGGETSVSYTIGSAATSCWEIFEISGLAASPYDISAGQLVASGAASYTTPTITPTAGERLIVASMGGSTSAADFTGLSAWLNSFVEQNDTFNNKASGTRDIIGMGTLSATADGLTGYSSGATYSPNATARTGIVIAFKVAAAGGTVSGAAALTGAGTLSAAATVTVPGTAALAGAGTVTAVSGSTVAGTASASAAGAVTATGLALIPGAGSAAGLGALTATGAVRVPASAAASASSGLVAVATTIVTGAVALSGAGSLTAVSSGRTTYRPTAGSTARPGTGVTARPNTGVTSRP